MKELNTDKWMSIDDTAAALNIRKHSLCNYVAKKKLSKSTKIDGIHYYLRKEVDAAVAHKVKNPYGPKSAISGAARVKRKYNKAPKGIISMALDAPLDTENESTAALATTHGMVAIAFVPVSQLKATLAQLVAQ